MIKKNKKNSQQQQNEKLILDVATREMKLIEECKDTVSAAINECKLHQENRFDFSIDAWEAIQKSSAIIKKVIEYGRDAIINGIIIEKQKLEIRKRIKNIKSKKLLSKENNLKGERRAFQS
jgi:hypothetical protein